MFDELREMNNEIREKQEKLAELRALAVSMTRPYTNDRIQTSPTDRMSNLMCKIITLENEIDGMIDIYADEKQRAKNRIFKVKRVEWQDILYVHYIEQVSLGDIAKTRGVSLNSIKNLNNRALKCLRGIDETEDV